MPHVELPQTEFKVVILGDTQVGKTSLVLRFTEGHYREHSRSPTVGAFFLTKRVQTSSGITAKVQIWDTAGQAQFRKMAPIYWRNSAAILLCYDVSSVHSWNVAEQWLRDLRSDKNVLENNIVLALVATKSDLIHDREYEYGRGYEEQVQQQKEQHLKEMNSTVPMAQVEHFLQSMNYVGSMSADGPFNNSSVASIGTTPISNIYQSGGNGQIMHVHTSARNDENVDLLFQKVAEEVLFVRAQERNVWMNYGSKYRHYSASIGSNSLGDVSSGEFRSELEFLQKGALIGNRGIDNNASTIQSNTPATGNTTPNSYDSRQGLSSPTTKKGSNTYPQNQNESQSNRINNGNPTNDNKENQYHSSSGTSRETNPYQDAYQLRREDTYQILKNSRSKEIRPVDSSEVNGLCYGCVSHDDGLGAEKSSTCTIS